MKQAANGVIPYNEITFSTPIAVFVSVFLIYLLGQSCWFWFVVLMIPTLLTATSVFLIAFIATPLVDIDGDIQFEVGELVYLKLCHYHQKSVVKRPFEKLSP